MSNKPIILYGAGKIGQQALNILGDKVAMFCDNNAKLHGTTIDGKMVAGLDEIIASGIDYQFIITVRNIEAVLAIEKKLKSYQKEFEIFDGNELNFNNSREAFSYIYQHNLWGKSNDIESSEKFFSGTGSHKISVIEPYIKLLKMIIAYNDIKSITEIGCGDFWLMRQVINEDIKYMGLDVVDELIEYNQAHFGSETVSFTWRDVADERFDLPPGDLLIIRQVLQHLNNDAIIKIMKKTVTFKYVLVTEHIYNGDDVVYNLDKPINNDIRLYKKSGVYLDKPPFSLNNMIHLCEVSEAGGIIRTSLIINT